MLYLHFFCKIGKGL